MIATGTETQREQARQSVVFYPTFGRQIDSGWEVAVHGAVFDPLPNDYRARLFVKLLGRVLRASKDDLHSEIFRDRVAGFLHRGQRGKQLTLQLGQWQHVIARRTKGSGHLRTTLRLSHQQVQHLADQGHIVDQWLKFHALGVTGDERIFGGAAQLISPQGLSIISDIDDTIKHTGVGQRGVLLANTFLREFQAVQGMPAIFQAWAQAGAAFHYVSSSPWQLYEPLRRLFEAEGYPVGSFHLKTVRFRDPTIFNLFVARRLGKRNAIASLLRSFPQRKFILIGDSGEKDAEIYGIMARKFPAQVQRIFIRNLAAKPLSFLRARRAFRRVPDPTWHVFRDAEELQEQLSPHDLPLVAR